MSSASAIAPGAPPRLSSSGTLFALSAYVTWGFVPVFWKQLSAISASEILFYRISGSLVLVAVSLAATGGLAAVATAVRSRRQLGLLLGSSLFLAVNWWTFIYAVNSDRILDTSLGYYLTPLLNVAIGTLIFRERMSRPQVVAFVLATTGVAYLAWDFGALPWISLVLGFSFAVYGALRKFGTISSLGGLLVESCVLLVPATAYLVWLSIQGEAATVNGPPLSRETLMWLACTGLVTAFPLVCFASATRRLPLSALGFFQYISPCLSLVLAVWLYDEPFTQVHGVTFSFIWCALVLFSWDGFRNRAA